MNTLEKNREIKFRAWDIVEEVMMYSNDKEIAFQFFDGEAKVSYIEERHTVNDGIDIDYPCIVECAEFNLMQYTGLKDKNNKDIYEGDILQNPENKVGIAVYYDGGFKLQIYKGVTSAHYISLNEGYVLNKKITGNIYENPELLNK